MKTRMKIFQPKTKSVFQPELRRRPKKRSSLKFKPIFCPKFDENQSKKRYSLKFRQKKGLRPPFLCSNLLPKLQREGASHNFAFYSMLIILSWQPKGEGAMAQCPFPKYAPVHKVFFFCVLDMTRKWKV